MSLDSVGRPGPTAAARRSLGPALALAAALLWAAGCGGSLLPTGGAPGAATSAAGGGAGAAPSPTAASRTPAGTTAPPTIQVGSSSLGPILTDSSGRTVYEHTADGNDNSTCTGSCSAQWPPLSIPGQPVAGNGVTGTLGVFKRTDGTTQVAIDGHPLYLFAGDHGPGDTAGQGVQGQWYAVSPDGQPVASPAAQAAAQATVQVATSKAYGPILTDSAGATLYIYTQDLPGLSRCTGACAKVWPPLLVGSGPTPTAGPGVTGKIGTMQRSGGGTQVTINGQPLYTYSGDTAAGQTNGQGVANTWFVVEPSGAEHG